MLADRGPTMAGSADARSKYVAEDAQHPAPVWGATRMIRIAAKRTRLLGSLSGLLWTIPYQVDTASASAHGRADGAPNGNHGRRSIEASDLPGKFLSLLPHASQGLASSADRHAYWLLGIRCSRSEDVLKFLRSRKGSTQRGLSMLRALVPEETPDAARLIETVVYLPHPARDCRTGPVKSWLLRYRISLPSMLATEVKPLPVWRLLPFAFQFAKRPAACHVPPSTASRRDRRKRPPWKSIWLLASTSRSGRFSLSLRSVANLAAARTRFATPNAEDNENRPDRDVDTNSQIFPWRVFYTSSARKFSQEARMRLRSVSGPQCERVAVSKPGGV